MTPPVAILGIGGIPFRRHSSQTFSQMVYEAVVAALGDARVEIGEIDTVVDAGIDLLDGKGISNTELLAAAGCTLKEEVKLEEDGATAAYYAYLRLKTGLHRTALVFGYSKSTALSLDDYSSVMFNPVFHRPLGITDTVALALQAAAYGWEHGVDESACDEIVRASVSVATANPWLADLSNYAQRFDANRVATPLRRKDLPVDADGAVAMILGVDPGASQSPVWICGGSLCLDAYDIGDRSLTSITSARKAAERAFGLAGVHSPRHEIQVAEVSEPSTYHLMMICEALGLAEAGKGRSILGNEWAGHGPRVNPSGGLLAARSLVAAGLWRIAEAVRAIRAGARLAVAHGSSGIAMQSNSVFVLSGDRPR